MSTVKDVLVKARLNIIATEVDENGKEKQGQGRVVIDIPRIILDEPEWRDRLADALSVFQEGYQISAQAPPTAVTGEATDITATSGIFRGTVNAGGLSTAVRFDYGYDRTLDGWVTTDETPVTGTIDTSIHKDMTLLPDTRYYYRIRAVSTEKTVYGRVLSFKTPAAVV